VIRINSQDSQLEQYKSDFLENGIVRINNFLESEDASLLSDFVRSQVEFTNAFFIDNENKEASDKQIGELSAEQRRSLYMSIYQNAAQGVGFLYGRQKINDTSDEPLKELLSRLNESSTLSLISAITSQSSISHADGQVTRYRVGDFLTRHVDDIPGETREIAYVLGLSPQWHADWGGLLQQYSLDGTPEKSWAPAFNTLTIFNVKKVHSVTSIAPFAPESRYSITGWFRR
jgi:SM-20-related protein